MPLDPNLRYPLAVSLGAVAGALTRYYLALWFAQRFGTNFPYGVFFINLSGCFVMGFFITFVLEINPSLPRELSLLVAVGFLGSYTTFSTYGLDTLALVRSGNLLAASLYWGGSAVLGVICVQLGVMLARMGK